MTFIPKFRVVEDGQGGVIKFKQPSAEEWSRYGQLAVPSLVGGELAVREDTVARRLEFFELWCTEMSGYQNEDGEITKPDQLPVDLRLTALWRAFDRGWDLKLQKNSGGISVNT